MESGGPQLMVPRRLWHIARLVYYMLRGCIPMSKLILNGLQLLLHRGMLAGKALADLLAFHHSAFSCLYMDPNRSLYSPKEVEFSCSNTPAITFFHTNKKKHHHHRRNQYYNYDVATVTKAFEFYNSETAEDGFGTVTSSPMWACGKSSAKVRPLRITDSPFLMKEDEAAADGRIDKEAEEFISRFYDQLRKQQLVIAVTPEHVHGRRRKPV